MLYVHFKPNTRTHTLSARVCVPQKKNRSHAHKINVCNVLHTRHSKPQSIHWGWQAQAKAVANSIVFLYNFRFSQLHTHTHTLPPPHTHTLTQLLIGQVVGNMMRIRL